RSRQVRALAFWDLGARSFSRRNGSPQAGETARSAQHAAGNLDNRHVGIVCAASAHVNVSVLYQPLTAPTGLGLLGCSRRAPFGRAARGSVAPRKMACRLAREGKHSQRFKAINSRTGEGQPDRCPFLKRGQEWTPKRATLLCSPSCPCSAQSSLGRGIEFFLARPFLRSV